MDYSFFFCFWPQVVCTTVCKQNPLNIFSTCHMHVWYLHEQGKWSLRRNPFNFWSIGRRRYCAGFQTSPDHPGGGARWANRTQKFAPIQRVWQRPRERCLEGGAMLSTQQSLPSGSALSTAQVGDKRLSRLGTGEGGGAGYLELGPPLGSRNLGNLRGPEMLHSSQEAQR